MTEFVAGRSFITREGCLITIVEYKSCDRVVIEHQDYKVHRMEVFSNQFMTGRIKNRYKPSVHGVGYLGIGKHDTKINEETSREYAVWRLLLVRCYDESKRHKTPTYAEITVCDEWHNFQNFAEWYKSHEYYGFGYDLDKDLLVEGNKIYSPETCCLVPPKINTILLRPSKRNSTAVGVRKRGNRYIAEVKDNGKKIHIGSFLTEFEAFSAYKEKKESLVKAAAQEYRGRISESVYYALMSWQASP